MHGCKICHSRALFEAQNLSCGHQFCRDCLLALLPNSSYPVSILPQHIAIIICPECRQRCEYCQVYEAQRGGIAGTDVAPSVHSEETERKRRRKRAQFLQAYRREHDHLNRKSRSRFYNLLEEDQDQVLEQTRRRDNLRPVKGREGRARDAKSGLVRMTERRGIRKDDVRAIDHVNGRFVTCTIIPGPGQADHEAAESLGLGYASNGRHSVLTGSASSSTSSFSYAALASRNVFFTSRSARSVLPLSRMAPLKSSTSRETTKKYCLDSNSREYVVAAVFILLVILVIVTASVLSSSF